MDGVRAIADPVRREILELLREAPLPAGAVAEHFAISRPAVSRHLRVLLECGVVEVATEGRRRVYALRPAPLAEVAGYLRRLIGPAPQRGPAPRVGLDALATEVARTRRERRAAGPMTTRSGASAGPATRRDSA
ncbi:winged helix-turn-helix transcriptional regulator [Phycicoccus endophyticus]|uniref:Winged helix-turn-helix transcriptional regulator n=1 Tax=Phycicoccus endophyticus TaxID=1690220 RepID=A0A7G9R0Z2_9MICO|nr:metalloregulator ArsR/SmtB family transcription factor [Phycicoccus endophyticus]NHI19565.1 winged helix-turn-helix transcriptional regulator [Phycicoccus endophyticus]QNN49267.1 winged helix-turn-helix transcriptional regulator [Phycicoccus endophyticus]GGL40163.1 hypothetical protein GCM10012283_23380 [Phycicoccus endophyticus]